MKRRPSRASIVVSHIYSTIFEDQEVEGGENRVGVVAEMPTDSEYSVSEVSESFTLVQRGNSISIESRKDTEDTDIEEDDEFDEYSEVTFEPVNPVMTRARKSTVFGESPTMRNTKSHSSAGQLPCRCAETYRNYREKRRRAVSTVTNAHQNKHIQSTSEDNSVSSESGDDQSRIGRVRKKSKFGSTAEEKRPLVEGIYKLEANRNFEEYLCGIGTGPCSQDMVMRSAVTLTITQDMDKQWRISSETLIKAKSVRGYRTNNRKWTENKFKTGEPRPELLDDWDQRLVVTTLSVEEEGAKLRLMQVAEKDQMHCKDSEVEFDVDPEEPDMLIMTCTVGKVTAWRRFLRHKPPKSSSRKISAPF